jgi:hypothetical protein
MDMSTGGIFEPIEFTSKCDIYASCSSQSIDQKHLMWLTTGKLRFQNHVANMLKILVNMRIVLHLRLAAALHNQ